jgi:membrane protein
MRERTEKLLSEARQRVVDFMDRGPLRRGCYSLWVGMRRHNATRIASAMAFNLFLAAIPMLALAGWLVARVLGMDQGTLGMISLYLDLTPLELHEIVSKNFQRFSGGAVAPFALLGSLWLASSAFHMLMSVFETAVRARVRPWWRKRLIAFGCVLGANVAFALTVFLSVLVAGGPARILHLLRTGESFAGPLERAVAITIALAVAVSSLALFFRIAVDRPGLNRKVWPGAVVTVAIGALSSTMFFMWARSLASFALFYGSLAAVAIALAWIWLWCAALLFGAELNAQLEGSDRVMPPSTVRLRRGEESAVVRSGEPS